MLEESSTTSCYIICIFDDCNDKKFENIQSKINYEKSNGRGIKNGIKG